jgi:hypothetical protein
MSAALICPIENVKILVTDTGASDEMADAFANRGVQVLRV